MSFLFPIVKFAPKDPYSTNVDSAAGSVGGTPVKFATDIPGGRPAIDPNLTVSGTGPKSGDPTTPADLSSPFSPLTYSPSYTRISNPPLTTGSGGIDPTLIIIGIVVVIGIAAYFMVKR